ncbi:MAG TPA: LuxR C-terminal-related transcriptional regulator [Acidimicrobiales bacterium]|nr:LuxR C-terminal-related transcriptional regulator [Acidimicrobiales bacterium]
MLLGRQRELGVLDRLLAAARDGHGGAIVVLGEPGIGKTALIERTVTSAQDFRVLRTAGREGEMELAFAALQQLCDPALDRLERLPELQRDALSVVFGLSSGDPPDRLLVALAVLTLLSDLAAEQPLLCVVDDAQWLDRASAQAIAFVARRLANEAVAFLFGARELPDEVRGLPEMVVDGLGDGDARTLFGSVFPYRLDEPVLDRIVAETHGNPLALLELPRGLSPAQVAGGFGLPVSVPLAGRIEESFRRRLAGLPSPSRRLLLVAAADPTGDAVLVWRAAELLGIADSAQEAAEAEGLVDFTTGVVFRHPLVRSAVYGAASARDRRQAHQALAEATDPGVDPDRRAWHRAQATSRPDEEVAAELELSAGRAQARGGFAAAAVFMERSTELTLDPSRRAGRALVAAEAKRQAGALGVALRLAALAERGPLDDSQRAQLDVLRAQVSFASDRGSAAPRLLLEAARRLERLDVRRARETYLDALTAAIYARRLAKGVGALEVARAASEFRPSAGPPRASDLLLDGLALLITDGYASGTPVLKRALSAFRGDDVGTEERLRWSWLAGRSAAFIWDYDSWDVLTALQIQVARDAGLLTVLPLSLGTRAVLHLFAGNVALAASVVEQVEAVADAIDAPAVPYSALAVTAFRGRDPEARQLIDAGTKDFATRGDGLGFAMAMWATALLNNGLARYQDAFVAAEGALEDPYEVSLSPLATIELVEAASRIGKEVSAAPALERLAQGTSASGTGWALAIEARCRALLSRGEAAETLYRQAIDLLMPTMLGFDLARTRLLYGEWLRRERRPRDAREQLRAAHGLFSEFGMDGFTERARVELRATGEHARQRTVETPTNLTPRETQISQLVAQGATNREIAEQLFVSPTTVEYHLRKVFSKLGVKSRTQLAHRISNRLPPRRTDLTTLKAPGLKDGFRE